MARLILLCQLHAAAATMQQVQQQRHHHHHNLAEGPRLSDGKLGTAIASEDLQRERETIFRSVQEVASGMDDGVSLHRRLSKEKVSISEEEQKIGHLRKKAESIREAHDVAARKLHSVMMPHIALSEHRLEKKRASVARRKQEVQRLEEVYAGAHEKAVQASAEKNEEAKILSEANEEVRAAMKKVEEAKHKFSTLERQADQDAHAFQFADTKLSTSKAVMEREVHQEEAMEAALRQARETLSSEELRFDEEAARKVDSLEKKLNSAEVHKEEAERSFFSTKDEFLAWQASQKQKAREVAAMKSDFAMRQEALYESERPRRPGHSAEHRAVDEDWAWSA